MKCLFNDEKCYAQNNSHDACRKCKNVPNMDGPEGVVEMRFLCAVAGKRDLKPKQYGSITAKRPMWFEDILNNNPYNSIPCTDHRRYRDGIVINEPYSVHMESIKKLIIYCEKNGLTFTIDGDSAHFPGRCFRILIVKKSAQS